MRLQPPYQDALFFDAVLNTIDHEVVVIRSDGAIVFVNKAWSYFASRNQLDGIDWVGVNYLSACSTAALNGDNLAHEILEGISRLIEGSIEGYSFEYPCHSPNEKRWFMMTARKLAHYPDDLYVLTHTNITDRKLAEEKVETLSLHDSLTGLSNRRHLEQFLGSEWPRNKRNQTPISLIIFDVDSFKLLNDRYGHLVGDICLKDVASVIRSHAQRASDLASRWGGEEFILLLSNTDNTAAFTIAEEVRQKIECLNNANYGKCTVSAGLMTVVPNGNSFLSLIECADKALYRAKHSGKNKVINFLCNDQLSSE